jgi:hypothetical protein
MKKQLLIAAVAATMTSAAMADISITGGMKVNYKDSDHAGVLANAISHETDLQITGKSGGTSVYIELNNDSADGLAANTATTGEGNFDVEDVWMKTTIAGATVKAGTWNGSDSIVSKDSDRALGKFEVSKTISGVTVIVDGAGTSTTTGASDANKNITFKGDVAGVAVSYKIDDNDADEYKLSTTMNGITVAYHNVDDGATASTGKSSIMVSGSYQGFDLAYAQADADSGASISGDSFFGDMAAVERGTTDGMTSGDDVSGFSIKTNVAGNALKARFVTIDATTATNDSDIVTLTATRALASGVTVEATYTDEDSTTAANDKEVLDLELAVKF